MREKIVSKDKFQNEIRPVLKSENKKIALCHGVFDLVHPGHVIHLQQAKELSDVLVVSITAAAFVRKGPERPYFDDEKRLGFLAALECVDYVLLSEEYTADDIISLVQPDFYVKGSEYQKEDEDVTGMISHERELVESFGGQIAYTGGDVFSSTKLINTALSALSPEVTEYMKRLKKEHSVFELNEFADKIQKLKILVIGDVIIDRYTYCKIQGLITKDIAYSARHQSTEDYLGGSVAIARHIFSFTDNVTLMSIVGDESDINDYFEEELPEMDTILLRSKEIPTIIKQRFLRVNSKREDFDKIFAINNILDHKNYEEEIIQEFTDKLNRIIEDYDVVFLCDFGHGLVGNNIMDIVEKKAKKLVLNCQTNSTNKGKNIITKYNRADVFSLDQAELELAYPAIEYKEESALSKLYGKLGGVGFLTRGAYGAACLDENGEFITCPAFALKVKDTIGAGDAFFATAGLFLAVGAPREIAMVAGNISGALGANIIGNKEAVEKVNVLKYASTLFNV